MRVPSCATGGRCYAATLGGCDAPSGTVTCMILVGLTGGIGSGKSTVCDLLVERARC